MKKTIKNNKNNKMNIILDLDECCVNCVEISKYNYDNFNEYKSELKKRGYNVEKIIIKRKNEEDHYLVFIRPYLQQFINYLFKKYNVSVWSNGDYHYVNEICNIIFTKEQKIKLHYILARKYSKKFKFIPTVIVYDTNRKKKLYDLRQKKWIKDLSYLFKNKPYSNLFNKENTILIDNLKAHLDFNKTNIIHVKDWYFYDYKDTILIDIMNYFKKNKTKINPYKLKHFTTQRKKISHKNKSSNKKTKTTRK